MNSSELVISDILGINPVEVIKNGNVYYVSSLFVISLATRNELSRNGFLVTNDNHVNTISKN